MHICPKTQTEIFENNCVFLCYRKLFPFLEIYYFSLFNYSKLIRDANVYKVPYLVSRGKWSILGKKYNFKNASIHDEIVNSNIEKVSVQ